MTSITEITVLTVTAISKALMTVIIFSVHLTYEQINTAVREILLSSV